LVILREVLIAFGLLLVFMFIGEGFLPVMNLSSLALHIAGGGILFLIALRMIFPPPAMDDLPGPLAIPALAGRQCFDYWSRKPPSAAGNR